MSRQNAAAGGKRLLQIAVTDTGLGIPAEFRERVFEKFFRVEPLRLLKRMKERLVSPVTTGAAHELLKLEESKGSHPADRVAVGHLRPG